MFSWYKFSPYIFAVQILITFEVFYNDTLEITIRRSNHKQIHARCAVQITYRSGSGMCRTHLVYVYAELRLIKVFCRSRVKAFGIVQFPYNIRTVATQGACNPPVPSSPTLPLIYNTHRDRNYWRGSVEK